MKLPLAMPALIAIVGLPVAPSVLRSEQVEAPAAFELAEPVLLLSLHGAAVELTLGERGEEDRGEPTGGIRLETGTPDRPAPAVEVFSDGETFALDGPTEVGSSSLSIVGRLLPGQRVEIRGSLLTVTVRGSSSPRPSERPRSTEERATPSRPDPRAAAAGPDEQDGTDIEPQPEAPPLLKLQAAESRFFGSGLDDVEIEIEDGNVRLEYGTGRLSLVSRDSVLVVETHAGPMRVAAVGGQLTVADQEGKLDLELADTDLRLHAGSGPIHGEVTESLLRVEDRTGPLELEAAGSDLTLSRVEEAVDLRGSDLEIELDSLAGKLAAELSSSRVRARRLEGPVEMTLDRESTLELAGTGRGASIEARESEVRIVLAEGATGVKLEGGRLEAEQVANLALEAQGAAVVARDVLQLRRADLVDTQFDLGLESVSQPPSLALRGLSDGVVRLRTPCTVSLAKRQSETDRRVRISGCELDTPGRRGKAYQRRRLDGGRATKLLLVLEGDATVEVDGRP